MHYKYIANSAAQQLLSFLNYHCIDLPTYDNGSKCFTYSQGPLVALTSYIQMVTSLCTASLKTT